MIDSLVRLLSVAESLPRNGYPERYALVTLHDQRTLTIVKPLKAF